MKNTIILKRGYEILTTNEYKKFTAGDTIMGDGSDPEELMRWSIEHADEAKKALADKRCSYEHSGLQNCYYIEEFALEYCECDEDGEFVDGSDYDFAETR